MSTLKAFYDLINLMSYASNRKSFPKEITSHDLLKAIAVVLMFVDHIGYYYFPEEMWLRVIGRLCVPMWFFLVGYASSRDLTSPSLWVGGLALALTHPVVGMPLFPLNILVTIMVVRLVLDVFIQKMLKSTFDTFMGWLVIILLLVPTLYIVQYGTSALALAFVGYMARNKKALGFSGEKTAVWLVLITAFFSLSQLVLGFPFDQTQMIVLFVGVLVINVFLYAKFDSRTFKGRSALVSFLGRYTLEIYVVHLIILKLLAVHFGTFHGPDGDLEWFNFYLFSGMSD